MSVLATFFVACEEQLSNVGENNNEGQFDLLFEEFKLPSHVIIDSINTSQTGLLTGRYVDSEFGTITSEAYSAFTGIARVDLSEDKIVFDSLRLFLRLTPYYYGANTETPIIFRIHELNEEITDLTNKTNFTSISYDPNPIGEVSYVLEQEKHNALTTDTLLTLELDDTYFQRVKDTLSLKNADMITNKYTTSDISPERGFYGFAILADGDKVVGINTTSQLSITYHTLEEGVHKDTTRYNYAFADERYNKITSDRSGTPISELRDDAPNTPFEPGNKMRYIQSGTGIATELDFQPFLDFFDDQDHVAINSVELSFGDIESTTDFTAPRGLSLLNTNENSELASLEVSTANFSSVQSDASTPLFMPFIAKDDAGIYRGLSTQYFQLLYDNKVNRSTAILRSTSITSDNTIASQAGFTVDRFVINQDSIKFKVFYTIPK